MKKYIHQLTDRGDNIEIGFTRDINRKLTTIEELYKRYNLNDYYILKASNKFRLISIDDFKTLKFCKHLLLKKDIYCINYINKWLDFINYNKFDFRFITKPFPPVEILNKIKIIN
jgi:hypothetical protein